MSKYNLTDILEQYKIGSGWTSDFDYEGMLNAGLKATLEDRIESLEALAEDFTDVNYHREASHLYDALEALEKGDAFEAEGKISDFHAEIRKTMESFDMDMSDDLGAYMASKMDENTEAVDLAIEASQEKAGIKEDKEMDEIAGYDRKGNKQEDSDGSDASKYKRAAMDVKEEKFSGEDEMQMHLKQYREGNIDGDDLFQAFDEIINGGIKSPGERGFNTKYGMEESDAVNFNMKADADYDEGLEDIEEDSISGEDDYAEELSDKMRMKEALPKFKGVPPMRDIVKALKDDAKATDSEIKQFMASVKKAGDEFDDVDDYVEDFKNYVADKALQEHFGRFMKDYQ